MGSTRVYPQNPFKPTKFSISGQDLVGILGMTKSGISLYILLLESGENFIAHDGIAYLNPIEMMEFLDCTRKSVYNGIDDLIIKNILARTGKPGEYFYNPKFFPYGIGDTSN